MTPKRLRKLGLAGALAIAGLLFAPLAASAELNKCSKELTKNAAKVATDVQKELDKCVTGWLKDEDKVAANLVKGKVNWQGDGESSGLLKAAEKCEKSIAKIGMVGIDVATVDGVAEKSKLGKSYLKLVQAASIVGSKPKCGIDPTTKVFDATLRDDELSQLGWLKVADVADVSVRLMVMGGVADAWNTQGRLNRDSYRVFQAMGNNRCAVTGVACDSDADCDPNSIDKNTSLPETCDVSRCPDCLKMARAVDSSLGSPATFCSDNSPSPGIACVDETSCGGTIGVTDYCDTAPSQGAMAGPCYMAACQAGNPATSGTTTEMEGVLPAPPLVFYACDDDPKCTIPPAVIGLASDYPLMLCDIQEVLPNAVGIVGGSGRGIRASVAVISAPICIDSAGYTGYVDKTGAYPQFNVSTCVDVDQGTDWGSGAGAADGCAAATNCRDEVVESPPGTVIHTGKICQDLVSTASAAGHALVRNDQIVTAGVGTIPGPPTANPCDPTTLIAAGEPSPVLLTTHVASGNLWDAGPINTGLPQPIIMPGNFAFNNLASGTPFDANALAGGALDGTMVSSFGTIPTDTAATTGASLSKVILDCQP